MSTATIHDFTPEQAAAQGRRPVLIGGTVVGWRAPRSPNQGAGAERSTCAVCCERMTVVHDDQTTHPLCSPDGDVSHDDTVETITATLGVVAEPVDGRCACGLTSQRPDGYCSHRCAELATQPEVWCQTRQHRRRATLLTADGRACCTHCSITQGLSVTPHPAIMQRTEPLPVQPDPTPHRPAPVHWPEHSPLHPSNRGDDR